MGILGFLGFIGGFIWLLRRLVKKGNKKQPLMFMLVCFITFIMSVSMYDDSPTIDIQGKEIIEEGEILGIEDIQEYEWGDILIDSLSYIGAEEIEEIKTEVVKDSSISFKITTAKTRLWSWIESDYSNVWSVKWIKDYDSKNYYYINEKDKHVGDSILKEDIYSYETGEIKEKADTNVVKAYYDNQEAERKKERVERERTEIEAVSTQFLEIYDGYKSNELVADDKYKGNRYTIIGKFETVKDDGLVNTLFKEIGVTVTVEIDNKEYNLWCKFDDSERENLKRYKTGDLITFTGECVSWGNWANCKVK